MILTSQSEINNPQPLRNLRSLKFKSETNKGGASVRYSVVLQHSFIHHSSTIHLPFIHLSSSNHSPFNHHSFTFHSPFIHLSFTIQTNQGSTIRCLQCVRLECCNFYAARITGLSPDQCSSLVFIAFQYGSQ